MKKILVVVISYVLLLTQSALPCSVTLSWTAPGDDGMQGIVSKYDIRYSTSFLSESNWDLAQSANTIITPVQAGGKQSVLIEGLETGTNYYFALKSCDDVDNWAVMSNVVLRKAGMGVCEGMKGNVNCDEEEIINIADIITLVDYIFLQGNLQCCLGEANVYPDANNEINIVDLTVLIDYFYFNADVIEVCAK